MANVSSYQIIENGQKFAVVRYALISDGTPLADVVVFDGSAGGPFGVNYLGQTYYPLTYWTIQDLWFDVQDQKFALYWQADTPELAFALGTSPEDFKFAELGNVPWPSGLTNPTGIMTLDVIDPSAGGTLTLYMRVRKNAGPRGAL